MVVAGSASGAARAVHLTLFTREECCLCDDMKAIVARVAAEVGGVVVEICDVDADPAVRARFGDEVPVLFVDGRKAFKYRLSAEALRRRIARARGAMGWRRVLGRLR